MAQIVLTVNGRPYPVACDDGQEERIRELGQYLDGKVAAFAKDARQAGDARLLLLAALVVTDELAEATEALRRERAGRATALNGGTAAARAADGPNGAGRERDAAAEAVLAAGLEGLAARIEAVAARLEETQLT